VAGVATITPSPVESSKQLAKSVVEIS